LYFIGTFVATLRSSVGFHGIFSSNIKVLTKNNKDHCV